MSSAPPPPPSQWEELNRPRSEHIPPPPPPPPPVPLDLPLTTTEQPAIDPFALLGMGALAFVLFAGGFMVLGGFIGSSNVEATVTSTEPPPTSTDSANATSTTATSTTATSSPATSTESGAEPEATVIAAAPPVTFDVPPDLTREEAAVFRIYLLILGREPDTSGLEYWSGELATGTPLDSIGQTLMATEEFVAEYGERPGKEQLVELAHRRIHQRPPTDLERAFWDGLDVEGIEFLIAFSNSPEARRAFGSQ